MSSTEEEFTVEKICDHQIRKNKTFYLIKWKGYNDSENSWEPEENLNCPSILNEYKAEHILYSSSDKKNISEIVGFKEVSTNQDMLYIVRFEDDEGYTEIPSSVLKKRDPIKLIEFYEKHLPSNDQFK